MKFITALLVLMLTAVDSMLSKFSKLSTAFKVWFVSLLTVASTSVFAAVPTEITDLLTAAAVDFGLLLSAGLVLWAAIKGPMVVWDLGARVLNRAKRG